MVACASTWCASVSVARAYSDVHDFAYPTSVGGGGGRFFTGSPADGYTCRICHGGAAAPRVRVLGLPLAGYRPGVEYEVAVDWWDGDALSAAVEVTDNEGLAAGTIRLPSDSRTLDAERCRQDVNEPMAATLVSVPPPDHRSELDYLDACLTADRPDDCRQVISVPACGSGRLRFAWRAPDSDIGPIWFSGAVVLSNDDGDTSGDGVAEIGTLLPSGSDAQASVRTYAGCSATPNMRPAPGTAAWLMLIASGLTLRLRRRQPVRQPATDANE